MANTKHQAADKVSAASRKLASSTLDAAKSGSFKIGGDISIHRLGFGAMRITGPGIWGPPEDPAEAILTLARLPELGVNFVDTAASYGPDVSEELIREVLHPYDGMLIATKAGFDRPRAGEWKVNCDPEGLRRQALRSREKLGVEQIDLWQLHRVDPDVPREAQFAAVRSLAAVNIALEPDEAAALDRAGRDEFEAL